MEALLQEAHDAVERGQAMGGKGEDRRCTEGIDADVGEAEKALRANPEAGESESLEGSLAAAAGLLRGDELRKLQPSDRLLFHVFRSRLDGHCQGERVDAGEREGGCRVVAGACSHFFQSC